jgi:hypothetical protein
LFEKGWGENWFRCNEKFNEEKEDGEYECQTDGYDNNRI